MPSETQRWLGDSPQKITQYSGRQYSACGLPNLKTESNYLLLQIGEGNGTPLQYSCLENPMDGGAWWAAVHGVTTSWTRLSDFTFTFHFHFSLSCIGEGNGTPLQYSCLENPRDGGARWAAVYGVTQSWTRLKQLGSSSNITDGETRDREVGCFA